MTTTAAVRNHIDPCLYGAVNAEWRTLQDLPAASPDGTPWPLPFTPSSIEDIITTLHDRTCEHAIADSTLLTLLQLHRNGDELAGRVVLQAMLGASVRQVPTALGRGLDGEADALAALWVSIATYPLHRTARVAANLALDALKHLQKPEKAPLPVGDALTVADDLPGAHSASWEPSPSDEATKVILWGLDHDVITQEEGRLLAHFYLGDGWGTSAHTPAERKRRSRAVRKLALAASQLL